MGLRKRQKLLAESMLGVTALKPMQEMFDALQGAQP
jgi:hypothetical protein